MSPASVGREISSDRLLIVLLIASLVGAVVQITMGGAVRVTGSGDGCPDWPTCFGSWIPPFEYHALMEYTHRVIGSVVGIVIIAAVARVWLRHRSETAVAVSATLGLVAVSVAGVLGGAVVLSELDPGLRTLHLTLAESVVAILAFSLVASLFYSEPTGDDESRHALLAVSIIAAALTLAALLSGSYAVWRGVGEVCSNWPLCGNSLLPQTSWQWIHMTHRILAFASAVAAVWAGIAVLRSTPLQFSGAKTIRNVGSGVIGLVAAQTLLGAANPWTDFAQWARVSHLTFATLQWAALLVLVMLLLRPHSRGVRHTSEGHDAFREATTSG